MRLFFRMFLARCLALAALAAPPFAATHAQTTPPGQGSGPAAVLVVGDSLSAEYGIARDSGWASLLARRLSEQYPNYRVVNASISGDTSSGGVARLPSLLAREKPAVVLLELGSNDALRGLSMDMTERNLRAMAQAARQAGAKVVLIGMQIPPNYGRTYAEQFKQVFPKVAEAEDAALVPFLIDGIALDRDMFQADGIHPNEQAQEKLLDNVWRVLQPLL